MKTELSSLTPLLAAVLLLALSGVGLLSRVSFEIPGDSMPLTFKVTLWRAPDVKNIDPDATPATLYETMATEAFKRFTKQYLATLFAGP